jgi:EAL domain-containing protein (putative c-di-GMP-specific phosphodiesterase class I)/GGDEF domain-containing protein
VRAISFESGTLQLSVAAANQSGYQALWAGTLRVFLIVVLAGLCWAAFAMLLVRWLKRAFIDEITSQVETLVDGKNSLPGRNRVQEFAEIGSAVREAREQLRASALEQAERIESLQLELNRDPVTGLATRRYFLNELTSVLNDHDGLPAHEGHVLVFRQRDLVSLNRALPRAEVDQWLRSVIDSVNATLNHSLEVPALLGRLNGSDFACLMTGVHGTEATRVAQAICRTLEARRMSSDGLPPCRWAMALTNYGADDTVSTVLSRLDHALTRAENAGHGHVEYVLQGAGRVERRVSDAGSVWYRRINSALEQNDVFLQVRAANYEGDGDMNRYEAFACIPGERAGEEPLGGYLFMPPAARLGLSGACDLRVIDLALQWLDQNPGNLVVRVSMASLLEPDFIGDTCNLLAGAGVASRLTIELDAHVLVALPTESEAFCAQAQASGTRIGLRRFAEEPSALMALHRIQLSYLKLGGELVINMLGCPGGQQLMVAITDIAIGMGIKVYADDVPDESVRQLLQEYGAQCALA